MPPEKIPFRVVLHLGSKEKNFSIPLRSFCAREKEAVIDSTYLLEFSYVNLEFSSEHGVVIPENARLYMDGLDGISDEKIKRDLDGAYLECPCNIPLYNNVENYPWIPGQYRIKVVWGNSAYFTILKVKSKYLTDSQLEIMRKDLENCIKGLAIDLALPGRGIGASDVVQSLPLRFYQYSLLEKEFPRLYASVTDILQKPHQQAIKEHKVVPVHKARVWDSRTLCWLNSVRGRRKNYDSYRRPQFVLAPRSKIHYDLPENQWIKKILMDFVQVCNQIQKAIENTIKQKKDELKEHEEYNAGYVRTETRKKQEINYLYEDLERCNKLQGRIWQLLNHSIFNEVRNRKDFIPITPGLQRDFRYLGVFRFWQQLFNHSEVQVQSAVDYQWKRTDLLYEYWIFVKILEILQELGFKPLEGWIYSHKWRFGEPLFIPSIKPGTAVILKRGKWRMDLVYNQSIPYVAKTAKENGIPVWSEFENNKPDLRLDLYRHEEYYQSFIFEVKYRRLKNIWNHEVEDNRRLWTENMRQLRNYRIGLSSVTDHRIRPIDEVVAFYPGSDEDSYDVEPILTINEYRIALVKYRPGQDNQHVIKYLRDNLFGQFINDSEMENVIVK